MISEDAQTLMDYLKFMLHDKNSLPHLPAEWREEPDFLALDRDLRIIRELLVSLSEDAAQIEELLVGSRELSESEHLRDEIIQLSQTDKLTQLCNRLKLDEILNEEYKRANRTDLPFAIIFLNFDHFKWVNDRFGHSAGDVLLKKMAKFFQDSIRATDSVGRWEDEAFLFILPDTDEDGLQCFTEKIRQQLIAYPCGQPDHLTASMGGTVYRGDCTLKDLINRADRALCAAKKGGRNQVQLD
jgi:diguanylate cyclase (GGDEF)-like protein